MSRIGKSPIAVPGGVDVTIDGGVTVTVKGPKGTLSRATPRRHHGPPGRAQLIVVERPDDERENRSLHGLTRTLVNNMVVGVTDGFSKELEIIGVGYRAEAVSAHHAAPGPRLQPPGDRRGPRGHHLRGARPDPQSSCGASTRKSSARWPPTSASIRKPEPYKGKGVRYLGEKVLRKAGKTGKK